MRIAGSYDALQRKGGQIMAIHYCEKCKKPLVRAKPHYIPLGTNEVLKIIDETCEDCGGAYINENQQTTIIKNKEAHDRLIEIMKQQFKVNGG